MEKEVFVLTKCVTGNERGATGIVEDVWVFDTFDEAFTKFEKESKKNGKDYFYHDEHEYIGKDTAWREYEEMQPYYFDEATSEFVRFEIHKVKKGGI